MLTFEENGVDVNVNCELLNLTREREKPERRSMVDPTKINRTHKSPLGNTPDQSVHCSALLFATLPL